MRQFVFCGALLTALAGAVLNSAAQTNATGQSARWFILPAPQLRDFSPAHPIPSAKIEAPATTPVVHHLETKSPESESNPSDSAVLTSVIAIPDIQSFGSAKNFNLDSIRRVEVHLDPLSRSFDSILRPEYFHLGKTTASCSIWNAIKRKNPLCLLNQTFLHLSW